MSEPRRSTSVWLTDRQKAKLRQLAQALGTSPNAALGQLVDNAEIALVARHEAVATLPAKTNRHDAKVSQATSIMTVSA